MATPRQATSSPGTRFRRSVARFALTIVLAAVAIPVVAAPAFAGDPKDCSQEPNGSPCRDLTPVFTCVWNNGNGTYTAVFGYINPHDETILDGVGAYNRFDPQPTNRGQITSFPAGSQTSSFTVTWNGTPLVWRLPVKFATASAAGTPCPSPPVPALGNPWILIGFLVAAFLVVVVAGRDRVAPPRSPRPRPLPVPAASGSR